jgi:biotin carboxyl carrier protein
MIHRYAIELGGQELEITLEPLGQDRYRLKRGERTVVLDARRVAAGTWSIAPDQGGAQRIVDVEGRAPDLSVTLDNIAVATRVVDGLLRGGAKGPSGRKGPQSIASPMPGKVVRLLVRPGEALKAGQGVAVVEAMKMENELRAPRDAKVIEVRTKEGQAVEAGETLVTLE